MDKISSTFLETSNNKENQSIFSNFSISSLKKTRIRLTQPAENEPYSQNQDSDIESNLSVLQKQKKKYLIKRFLSAVLNLRKTKDSQQSKIQICEQHLCFRIFQAWKKVHQKSRISKAQAQMFEETQVFNLKRKCLIGWMSLIKRDKCVRLQRKRQIFQAFKLVCSIQLSIRIKRLRVQGMIKKYQATNLLQYLKQEKDESAKQMKKAEQYWISTIKIKTFRKLYRQSKNCQRNRVRYQKYQLAYLFSKKTLLQRYFAFLKPLN